MSPLLSRPVPRLLVTVVVVAGVLTGCSQESTDTPTAAPKAALGHVHGLGTDPESGTLYVASHLGVYTLTDDGTVARVADRWQDTMAFTVIGPGHLLASGHPDLREGLPVQLGLIESRDGAESWRPVALAGKADFHALESVDGRVWGFDAVSGRLLTTTDRETWTTVDEGTPVVDLAAGADPESVLVTTPEGRLLRYAVDSGAEQVDGAPPVVLLDRADDDRLVGVTADGVVHVAGTDATRWRRAGEVPGVPQAFDTSADGWHVATTDGIHRSTDEGRTWSRVIEAETG